MGGSLPGRLSRAFPMTGSVRSAELANQTSNPTKASRKPTVVGKPESSRGTHPGTTRRKVVTHRAFARSLGMNVLEAVPEPEPSRREATLPGNGPRPLFEDLYRGSRDDLYSYVAGLLRDRAAAEDVTALAFERAFRKWDRFDPQRGSARGWLFGIARNAALDELRKRKREAPAFEPDGLEAPGPVAGASVPVEETVVAREQRALLLDALGTLAPADREIVALKFFGGLSNTEIAEATGYSSSNVGTRTDRAMSRLRKALASGKEVVR